MESVLYVLVFIDLPCINVTKTIVAGGGWFELYACESPQYSSIKVGERMRKIKITLCTRCNACRTIGGHCVSFGFNPLLDFLGGKISFTSPSNPDRVDEREQFMELWIEPCSSWDRRV